MSPVDARVAVLTAEIERDWQQVLDRLAKAQSVEPAAGDPEAALVALSLDHAYQAFETLLRRVERALGLPERTGASWHAQLLVESGQPVPGLRPAVFPSAALPEWDGLMRFRHFLRHAYAAPLDPAKLTRNVERLSRAVQASDAAVRALVGALRSE